jgi:hypothetical protein
MRRLVALPLTASVALAALALAPPAVAVAPSRALWATVNICDTPGSPNAMGVRASMPGNGLHQRMYMRFSAQHWNPESGNWSRVAGIGVSPWLHVGSARFRSREAGWNFSFAQPSAGRFFHTRAIVQYQWRARKKRKRSGRVRAARWVVVMHRRRVTRSGIFGVDAGDPPGTSRASCLIT